VSVILTWVAGTLLVLGSGLVLYFVAQADVASTRSRTGTAPTPPQHDVFSASRAA
jgi:hypothetical protein